MKSTTLIRMTGTALFAVLAIPTQIFAQDQSAIKEDKAERVRYTVTDLGPLPGGNFSEAFVIKNNGLAAGKANLSDNTWHAALWYKGLAADIATPGLGGRNSQAFGINERFQAVGQAETLDPNGEDFCGFKAMGLPDSGVTCRPFLWQDGVMAPLPTLGGANGGAQMINDHGQAVGYAENDTQDTGCPVAQFKPVTWKNGKVNELPTFPGDSYGVAAWINDKGQVAGASGSCAALNPNTGYYLSEDHALLWEKDSSVHDLGNLGGSGGIAGNHACALNNEGQVVGHSELTNNTTFHGFLWTRKTGMIDLGTLDGDYASLALGINDAGQVVGASIDANFNLRAVLWENGLITDLNKLIAANPGLSLQEAISINSDGEITGVAQTSSGEIHAFLATPRGRDR